jgi:pSer/pThr/pTyr-binding forkhead associated (FHA) protein
VPPSRAADAPPASANESDLEVDVTITRPRRKAAPVAPAWTLSCDSQSWDLVPGSSYTIGRHPKCDVVLSDPLVSRRHVVLDVMSSGVHVRAAEGAKNPPTVDASEVPSGSATLVHADVAEIVVGDTKLQLRRT